MEFNLAVFWCLVADFQGIQAPRDADRCLPGLSKAPRYLIPIRDIGHVENPTSCLSASRPQNIHPRNQGSPRGRYTIFIFLSKNQESFA